MNASYWRLCVGAISNVVGTTAKAASPGRGGQNTNKLSEEIIRHPCWRSSSPIDKAFAAEGVAREVAS